MPYNRGGAVRYGSLHWNQVCHDRQVAILDHAHGHRTKLVELSAGTLAFQGNLVPAGENDCTHFVSCCIGPEGGGIPLRCDYWPAYGILSAPRLVEHLLKYGLARYVGPGRFIWRNGSDTPGIVAAQLEAGDVIAYSDRARKGAEHHLALYDGQGTVMCHTYARRQSFATVTSGRYVTLLHIG
jgi:hypothetical protein